jgi:hypothetical protein
VHRPPWSAPALERHGQVEGSTPAGLAEARLHRGEPDGWRAPRGSPGDRVGAGRRPGPAILRRSRCCADRAGGDTKTPRSRRALKLAQIAVGALRQWQADQAAEREAAGSHWQAAEHMTPRTALSTRPCKSAAGRSRIHADGVRPGMVTASNRTWQRPAAPVLLPESDTACCAVAVGAGPHSGNVREFQVQGAGYML